MIIFDGSGDDWKVTWSPGVGWIVWLAIIALGSSYNDCLFNHCMQYYYTSIALGVAVEFCGVMSSVEVIWSLEVGSKDVSCNDKPSTLRLASSDALGCFYYMTIIIVNFLY